MVEQKKEPPSTRRTAVDGGNPWRYGAPTSYHGLTHANPVPRRWLYILHPTSNNATPKKMNSSAIIASITDLLYYGHIHNAFFRNSEVVWGLGVEE